jgi:hypothetical protein
MDYYLKIWAKSDKHKNHNLKYVFGHKYTTIYANEEYEKANSK